MAPPSITPCGNAFVIRLDASGKSVVYSSYLGGTNQDRGNAIAVDASGNAYVAGTTNSPDFPVAEPLQGVGGGTCARIVPPGGSISEPCSDAFVSTRNRKLESTVLP